MKGHGGISEEK